MKVLLQDRQPKVEVQQGNAKPEVAAKDIEKTASIIKNVPPPLHIVQNHGFGGKCDNANAGYINIHIFCFEIFLILQFLLLPTTSRLLPQLRKMV